MKHWIQATRPKTFIISIGPVLLGTAVAIHYCQFTLSTFLCTLLAALFIQIGSHFANDYFDFLKGADTSLRIGPLKALTLGVISLKQMQMAMLLSFLLASLFTIPLILVGGKVIAFTLALSIFLAILYTATPFALAYTGFADITVFFMYGPIPVFLTTYLLTGFYSKFAFLIGLAPGAIATAVLTVANMRDIESDRLAGKMTLPARFGETFAKFEYSIMLLFASLVPLLVYQQMWLRNRFLFSLYMIIPAIALIKRLFKLNKKEEYASLLPITAQFLIFDVILLGVACLT